MNRGPLARTKWLRLSARTIVPTHGGHIGPSSSCAKGASPFSPGQRPGKIIPEILGTPTVGDTGFGRDPVATAISLSQPVGPQIHRIRITQAVGRG
jgi:hypothetical protein